MLQSKHLLLVGDLMLDTYTYCSMERISPEAPVPVLNPKNSESRPGGAGNSALNLVSLGQRVTILGRVGDDPAAGQLRSLMDEEGIDTSHLVVERDFPTPVKNRLVASGQQVMRIDVEDVLPLSQIAEEEILSNLSMEAFDAMAISDYGKGFCTPSLLTALIKRAKEAGVPIIVDPKGRDYSRYRGVDLIKPNRKELAEAAGLGHEATLDQMARKVGSDTGSDLLVTRSEEGISLYTKGGREDFPVHVQEVRDVTGAGDTVLAVLAATLASGLPNSLGATYANGAASLAIGRFGCARITLEELEDLLSVKK